MDPEQQLTAAKARMDAAIKALSKNQKEGEPVDVSECTGAPLPQLLRNDHRAFLLFYVKVVDPSWDGTYITIKDPGSEQRDSLALVEFKRCISAKLGDPNYDIHKGHPLAGKGLESETAQLTQPLHLLVPRLDIRVHRRVVRRRGARVLDTGDARRGMSPIGRIKARRISRGAVSRVEPRLVMRLIPLPWLRQASTYDPAWGDECVGGGDPESALPLLVELRQR